MQSCFTNQVSIHRELPLARASQKHAGMLHVGRMKWTVDWKVGVRCFRWWVAAIAACVSPMSLPGIVVELQGLIKTGHFFPWITPSTSDRGLKAGAYC